MHARQIVDITSRFSDRYKPMAAMFLQWAEEKKQADFGRVFTNVDGRDILTWRYEQAICATIFTDTEDALKKAELVYLKSLVDRTGIVGDLWKFQVVCKHAPKTNKDAYSRLFQLPRIAIAANTVKRSIFEEVFLDALVEHGVPSGHSEFYVAPGTLHGWRFDICYPIQRLAIELQGGTWTRGRHSRGSGQTSDYTKHNYATRRGWRIIYFTSDMFKRDRSACIDLVKEML